MIGNLLLPLSALALLAASPVSAANAGDDLVSRLDELAEGGSGEAAYHLGMIHHLGLEGVPKDAARAFDYFIEAAEAGDPLGAYKVGCFYAGQGEGVVEDDPELAFRYKLVAAEAGYSLAQQDVAKHFFERGDGAEAVRWLEAAAQQGDMSALAILSALHAGAMPAPGFEPDGKMAYVYAMAMVHEIPDGTEGFDRAALEGEIRADLALGAAELAEAETILSGWHTTPSALTVRAGAGLRAAENLAGNS